MADAETVTGRPSKDERAVLFATKTAFWVIVVTTVVQALHFVEHITLLHQMIVLAQARPRGWLGAIFDFPVVHFIYNASLLLAVVYCAGLWYTNRGMWRPSRTGVAAMLGLLGVQGYHVIEHTIMMFQFFHFGLEVPPGVLGQSLPLIIVHLDFNLTTTLGLILMIAGFRPALRPWDLKAAIASRRRRRTLANLPGGAIGSGVVPSGVISSILIVVILVFAQTAPASTVVPIAEEHCVGSTYKGPETTDPGWKFLDVAAEAGISHVVAQGLPPMGRLGTASSFVRAPTTETHPMESLTGAVAVGDADGDGWPDFYVADHGPDRLFRNQGDGTFEDVTERAGIADPAAGRMALWFDYDGDDDVDLFVANFVGPYHLWRNDGNWTFTDVTEAAGLADRRTAAQGATAADVDGDGDLDLSVVNYGRWDVHTAESNGDAKNGEQDLLFINRGDGTFREEAALRGIVETRWTFSHAWADFDRDGDQDLYHNNDFGFDGLYLNDGTGRFTDVSKERGMVTDGNGMGAVWMDYDNDEDLDLFAAAIKIACNRDVPQFAGNDLFNNDGTGRFTDVSVEAGIEDGPWAWDSEWTDLDLDGDLDAFQANGWSTRGDVDRYHDAFVYLADDSPKQLSHQNQGEQPSTAFLKYNATKYVIWSFYPPLSKDDVDRSSQGGHQIDRVWMNDGAGKFKDAASAVGLTEWEDTRAIAAIDYDRDGDMDLLRSSWHRHLELLHNPAVEEARGHWFEVYLAGEAPNTKGVGAILTLEAGGRTLTRVAPAADGFMSQSQAIVHFGLGDATSVERLSVTWPSGKVTILEDLKIDNAVVVKEA
ncbi:MAG TPA: CRTAC1 family protein [Candidatus Thermoplasmatota archaeon]|nr:CRTAC1 family protein [Candidatus Thermoplasmatota archaeon]